MRDPVKLRTVMACVVVVAIVGPILLQAWPVCGDEGMPSDMPCAGLWAADCCHYSVARERVQGSDDHSIARAVLAPPVGTDPYRFLTEPRGSERIPIERTPAASSGPGSSSTVLRL